MIKVPPIKSQGKKTKLADWIINELKDICVSDSLYIEPFVGTGVIGFNLAPDRAIFSDTNIHIINFYNDLKNKNINKDIVRDFLESEGDLLRRSKDGVHYYDVRQRFNSNPNSLDFLFLTRSCFN